MDSRVKDIVWRVWVGDEDEDWDAKLLVTEDTEEVFAGQYRNLANGFA